MKRKKRAFIQILVAVLMIVALLVGVLVTLRLRHTESAAGASALHPNAWNLVSSPNPGSMQNSLNGVAAVSANDIWAVGYSSGTPFSTGSVNSINIQVFSGGQPLIEHWNGRQWSVIQKAGFNPALAILNGVAAVSANDVWAVGGFSNKNVRYTEQTLIEHWDGTRWSIISSPNPGSALNILNEVSAISANDIWAVGYSSNNIITYTSGGGSTYHLVARDTLIEHWNGKQWSVIPSPNPGSMPFQVSAFSSQVIKISENFLDGVSAIAADDVWAVGGTTDSNTGTGPPLIEHWNGSIWSVVPNPELFFGDLNSGYLNAVGGTSANDVWAVGASGLAHSYSQPLIEHWNGTQWSLIPALEAVGDRDFLSGIAAVSANDIWVAGSSPRTYPQQGQALIEHWNGSKWSLVPSPNPGPYNSFLNAIARDPHADRLWAVGYFGEGYDAERAITEVRVV